MNDFELWKRVTSTEASAPYEWMVWRVGPMRDGETWFKTREEAEAFIALIAEQESEA